MKIGSGGKLGRASTGGRELLAGNLGGLSENRSLSDFGGRASGGNWIGEAVAKSGSRFCSSGVS